MVYSGDQMRFFGLYLIFNEKDNLYLFLTKRGFGEKNEKNELVLYPEEVLFLIEKGKIKYDFDEYLNKILEKDKDFFYKYLVYKDLRERGYFPKTGIKFGSDYRIYPKGVRPGEDHSVWLIKVYSEYDKLNFNDMVGDVRLARNVRKKMIYAVVTKDNEVLYYKVDRHNP